MATGDELPINENATPLQMANTIFGPGVTVNSASYTGWSQSSGIYSDGDNVAPGLTPSDTGVILSTGRASHVTQSSGDPNRSGSTSTNSPGTGSDGDFNDAANRTTYDASFLEVNFTPTTDFITMQFTFSSEEYPEYTGSIYNDIFGVWVNDTLVSSPVVNVTQINSVNQSANATLFNNNTNDDYNTEMDGFTVTLTLVMPVNIGVPNDIKIGIADVGDSSYDSNVLIAADSIQGEFIAESDSITHYEGVTSVLDVLANDPTSGGIAFITHINGVAVNPGDSVTLADGTVVTLLVTGELQIDPPASQVGLTANETINFTYTADDGNGITDTAFVTVTAIPCFARGTMILTEDGEKAVEDLVEGDMIETRDNGLQPIRWIGSRKVAAEGRFAPIAIEAGTLGMHRRLVVSPQHRVMLTHWMAELMFGEDEVLVAAKDLVNDCSIHVLGPDQLENGEVEYFHLLFDRHQIIFSEGLATESFLPGPTVMNNLDADVQEEVLALFPGIDRRTMDGYGPAARLPLRAFEARAMLA
ncbi:Hint domain-containing protein [Rhodobacteraceae bacterium N5(2021)]|uniref:Hint domain-containing protein n=2 Tax=Gymnodinialimonas phycosphaerae TaxID=2841589 RepID=A0A975TT59_9RHOB|nr:Hint domain-containing protein [Gymnodinialimonas phycosphaerae]MBY4894411.1 Hint domain-containing protein [Gymnodinialimonas phycosphaerae]